MGNGGKKVQFQEPTQGAPILHPMIGMQVLYVGKIWRVVGARKAKGLHPWLLLRRADVPRPLLVKMPEVKIVMD